MIFLQPLSDSELNGLPGGLTAANKETAASSICNIFIFSWCWSEVPLIVFVSSIFVFVKYAIAIVANAVKKAEIARIIFVIFISSMEFIIYPYRY